MLHTHSFTYHPHYIMFLSQHFSFPCQYHSTNAPYPFSHLPPTLYNVSLPVLQFPPVSTIPPKLHTHIKSTLHQRKMRSSVVTFQQSDALSECSRISSACRTTRSVKRSLPFSPLAFTHVPPDATTSKLFEDLMFAISVWALCLQNLCVYFGDEMSEFPLCCGPFFQQKFKFILRGF